MEVLWVIAYFALIIIVPISPQIAGFISYLLLKKHNDLIAHVLGVIIPPVSSFYLFQRLFSMDLNSPGQGVALLFLVSFLQLFFSALIQLAVHNRHKIVKESQVE